MAYSNGISVLDVRDPKNPRPVAFLPCPPDTRATHLQTHDDLLLAVNGPSMWTMQVDAQAYYSGSPADLLKGRQYTAGIRARSPSWRPRGWGRIASGMSAAATIHYPEFTDQVLVIVDMADKGLEGHIDNPDAGWRGRGVWTPRGPVSVMCASFERNGRQA
jgi:hypothetical protein